MSKVTFRSVSLFILVFTIHAEAKWVPGNLLARFRNRSHSTESGPRQPVGAPRPPASEIEAPVAPAAPSPFVQVSELKTVADTKTETKIPDEKLEEKTIPGRWVGDQFQYLGADDKYHSPRRIYVSENNLGFSNLQKETIPTKPGDVIFEIEGQGWFKAAKGLPRLDDPDAGWVINPEQVPLTQIEHDVIVQTNQARARRGLNVLVVSSRLMNQARAKSYNMAVERNMSHYGVNPLPGSSSENIAMGQNSATSVTNTWLNSKGHHANIMSGNSYIGVNSDSGEGTRLYHTQLFSRYP